MSAASPRIALIAGEISGDILGAAIATSIKARWPQAQLYGVAGPRMVAAGVEAIASIDELSVMGLVEVLRVLPRLLRFRKQLLQRLLADRPDAVVGIDAPDFNLGLERRLREKGIRTAHVVSPTVWAWRSGRVKGIAKAVDRMLCLYPFEPRWYSANAVQADYIGHPLADELDDSLSVTAARERLGIATGGPVLTVMPGSRHGEIHHLAAVFAQTAARLAQQKPGLRVLTPVAKPALRAAIAEAIATHAPQLDWTLIDGDSRLAMQAADTVLLASGTATLECLLLGRPMVVAYRSSALTAFLMLQMGLLKTRYVSLPNILADDAVVPELLQAAAEPAAMGAELLKLFDDAAARERQLSAFGAVRRELRRNAADRAAEVIIRLIRPESAT